MKKKKILVIDDKEAIGKLIALCLGAEYEFQYFSNALAGINWLNAGNTVDLILSDYTMPEMNGYDFLVMLKQNEFLKNIPVVFLSGEDSSSTRIKILESGAEDFILKPFNPLELKIRIKKVLK
ncbi:response regulator [Sphingobacterium corticibacterium]|uniref:Response regulator n=1 Tax=Sphingobacterium corticibacterium TaxID=2484746 RepID=A0A4Q6XPV3_9SPHI|nr:response regulator [Sphingobacterium corticibacterium]RZF59432.1 response regulator [Sphingobacterium corticibacterium]